MSFQVRCPSCNSKINVSNPKFIGKKVPCPKCKTPLLIVEPQPEVEELEVLPELEEVANDDPFAQPFGGSAAPMENDPFAFAPSAGAYPSQQTHPSAAMPGNDYWSTPVQQQPQAAPKVTPPTKAPSKLKLPVILGIVGVVVVLPVLGLGLWFMASFLFLKSSSSGQVTAQTGAGSAQSQPADDPRASMEFDTARNLHRIGLGVLNFESTFKRVPNVVGSKRDSDGKPVPLQLSWRVMILPFVEQQELYEQFHLDEPWDSPHNIQLLPKMPEVYGKPEAGQPGFTSIHMMTGNKMFGGHQMLSLGSIQDGMSNTLLVLAAGKETATEWTKPSSIDLDAATGMDALGSPPFDVGFLAMDFTLAIHEVAPTASLETLRAFATHSGAEATVQMPPIYRPRKIDSRAILLGLYPPAQQELEAFIQSGKAKQYGIESGQAKQVVSELRASLKKWIEELELSPGPNGNYEFPRDSQLQERYNMLASSFQSPSFKVPDEIKISPVAQALFDAAKTGQLSEGQAHCLVLYLLVASTR